MTAPVLIFGATGGIGGALAARLRAQGQPLFLTGRNRAKLMQLGDELGAPFAEADVLDRRGVEAVVAEAALSGQLAGLAYCVGSIVLKPLKQANEADYLDAFRINVLGAACAVRAAQAALMAGIGSVVLFSTVAVAQGFPSHSVVSAAKGGVEGLTRALAAELAPSVRVNAVAPSLTRTPLAALFTRSPAMANGIAALHPIPRLGEPEEIAAAAAFLLGPESGWITGQIIHIDGGRSSLRVRA